MEKRQASIATTAPGGRTIGAVVSSGGRLYDFGSASNVTTLSGGTSYVFSGGVASGGTVSSGGTLYELGSGSAFGVAVNGGHQYVLGGGFASGTLVINGGLDLVLGGGVVIGDTLSGGGTQDDLGLAIGTTVDAGGLEYVAAGGTISSATLSSGTVELTSEANGSGTMVFVGGGTLKLDGTGLYGFQVSGFGIPEMFDLVGDEAVQLRD